MLSIVQIKIKGTQKIMLSIRSNIPPWPGINLPKSLISNFLFIREADKSPNCAKTPIIAPIITDIKIFEFGIFIHEDSSPKMKPQIIPPIIPPIEPPTVFLGLISGANFFLPKDLPAK